MLKITLSSLFAVACVLLSGIAHAQTFNFTTGTQSWNVNGNWTPSGFPNAVGASATFNSPTAAQTVNLSAAITVGTINFTNNGTFLNTLANGTGGSLILDATGSGEAAINISGTSTATNNITISASTTLNDTLRLTNNNVSGTGAATATMTGTVTGAGGFIKDGPGRFSFSMVAKAYTGATVVNRGRLRMTSSGQITGTSSILVNSGGSLYLDSSGGTWSFGSGGAAVITLNGDGDNGGGSGTQGALRNQGSGTNTLANAVALASNATIHAEGSSVLQLNGALSGGFVLLKTGGGTLNLNNANTGITTSHTVTNGSVTVSSASKLGSGALSFAQTAGNNTAVTLSNSTQSISALSSAWVDLTGTFTQTLTLTGTALTIDQASDTTFGVGAVSTLTSVIAGTGSVIKSGVGKLTLTNANTYTGTTTISGGTISIDAENRLGGSTGDDVALNGGTLATTATFAIDDASRAVSVGASNGTINTASSTTLTLNNNMTGSGTLTKEGTGTLVLQGDGHSGNFIINAGTVRPGTVNNGLAAATASITINAGGTLDLNGFGEGFGSLSGSGTLTNNSAATTAVLNPNPTANATFDGLLVDGSGQIALQKSGNFNLKLSNAGNTFSGTQTLGDRALPVSIELAAGGIEFTSNGALGVAGGDIYIDGSNAAVDKLIFGADNITLDSGRQLNINDHVGFDTGAFTGTIAGAILGDDTNTNTMTIGGNDSFRKQGTGTLILTGTMDLVDEVFIDAGTLRAESTLVLAQVTIATGSTLQMGNGNATGDISGTVATVVNNGTVAFNRTGSLSFDHVISGTGGVEHNGSGTTSVTVSQTYTGNTTVSGGVYRQGAAIGFITSGAGAGDVVVNGAGALELGGFSEGINGLSGNGTVRNAAASNAALTVGEDNDSTTFSGVLEDGAGGGTLGLTKAGTGTQTLTGTNTYTGSTILNVGNLQVGVSSTGTTGTGDVTVNGATAVLSGSGTVNGNMSVITGRIMPGDSGGTIIGTLNTKSLVFTPVSGTTVAELQIASAVSYDLLSITGDLTLSDFSNLLINGSGYTATIGDSFNLIDWSGNLTLGGFSTGTNLRTGSNADLNEGNLDLPDISGVGFWQISNFSGSGSLNITVAASGVPEPSRALLLFIASGAALCRRRRTA